MAESVSILRELIEQEKLEREKNSQLLEGCCPACDGTTRYPDPKRSRKLSCLICCDEETPGKISRPRIWWINVTGGEP